MVYVNRNGGYRGQNSHPLCVPLNYFTHFGSRLVNETLYKFRRLPTHGALCLLISLLCCSFREPQITAPHAAHYAKTHTLCMDVVQRGTVRDLLYALLITDGCNCYKLWYLDGYFLHLLYSVLCFVGGSHLQHLKHGKIWWILYIHW